MNFNNFLVLITFTIFAQACGSTAPEKSENDKTSVGGEGSTHKTEENEKSKAGEDKKETKE